MIIGYIKGFKKYLIITLPIFIFLMIHSLISNKQERFMLPILPFFIIAGVVGMNELLLNSSFWQKYKKFVKISWIIFWSLSCIVLPFVTVHYSKKSRCEAMYYLNKNKSHITGILLNDMNYNGPDMMPLFYLGKWDLGIYEMGKSLPFNRFKKQLDLISDKKYYPQYVLFFGDNDLSARVDTIKKVMPDIVQEKIIYPGLIDRILHNINRHNNNQTVYIYRNNYSYNR